jgi:hypothetical protein
MTQFLLKTVISAVIIAAVSEIARRSTFLAAILASLPLTSILAMIWLYRDTGNAEQVARLSTGILWAIIPSAVFFIALPILLRSGLRFAWAMLTSSAVMALFYLGYAWVARRAGAGV